MAAFSRPQKYRLVLNKRSEKNVDDYPPAIPNSQLLERYIILEPHCDKYCRFGSISMHIEEQLNIFQKRNEWYTVTYEVPESYKIEAVNSEEDRDMVAKLCALHKEHVMDSYAVDIIWDLFWKLYLNKEEHREFLGKYNLEWKKRIGQAVAEAQEVARAKAGK